MRFLNIAAAWALIYVVDSLSRNLHFREENPLTWVPTNPSHWYSTAELCVIKNWSTEDIGHLADFSSKKCHGNKEADEWKGLISVGYGSRYETACTPPLARKHKLFQALRGFNESRSPYLLKALREMRDSNRPLVFLGDSVTRQTYIAFLAEVKRLDPRVGKLPSIMFALTVNILENRVPC